MIHARHVKPDGVRPGSSKQLQEFTGTYRRDEIDMPYTIILRGGKLVIRSLKSHDLPRLPLAADLFRGRGNRVRSMRGAQGKVTGALLNTACVQNFRFERMP
jgi:hypothetical protein